LLKSSTTQVKIVLNEFDDTDLANQIIDLSEQGIEILVAADNINSDGEGFVTLETQNLSIKKNTSGKMEQNFVVVDDFKCWISTSGFNQDIYSNIGGFAITFVIQSQSICRDFSREATQLVSGGVFSDSGNAEFDSFTHQKALTDPLNKFEVGGLLFYVYFAAQERPLVKLFTTLLNAKKSIKFMAKGLTQNQVVDGTTHSANRSHLLNILQYKNKISALYGGEFTIKGVIDDQLMGDNDSCSTDGTLANPTSIHCDLAILMGNNVKKYTGTPAINFNLFLLDVDTDNPVALILSSDLKLTAGFDLTDAFLIVIQKKGSSASSTFFEKMSAMIDLAYQNGEAIP